MFTWCEICVSQKIKFLAVKLWRLTQWGGGGGGAGERHKIPMRMF